jgi:hypothetical protein
MRKRGIAAANLPLPQFPGWSSGMLTSCAPMRDISRRTMETIRCNTR